MPRSAGGWNIINMEIWNKAALLKLLWVIAFKRDKLWVKWVHAYYIKRASYDTIRVSTQWSWILRKIIDTREWLQNIGGWQVLSTGNKFSIRKTYKLLRGEFDRVHWRRLICNNEAAPKSNLYYGLGYKTGLQLQIG